MPFSADAEYVQQWQGKKESRDNPKDQTAVVQKVDVRNWRRWCFCREVFCPPCGAGGRRYTRRQARAPECANIQEKRCVVADGVFLHVSSASQSQAEGRGGAQGVPRPDSEAIENGMRWNAAPPLLHDNLRAAH